MIKLETHRVDRLKPLFTEAIEEMGVGQWATVENGIAFATAISAGQGAVFVDDEDNPKAVVVATRITTNILYDPSKGATCLVNLIYVTPTARAGRLPKEAIIQVEVFARQHGCSRIMGGSLKLEGVKSIDSFWESNGFKPQETLYVKDL